MDDGRHQPQDAAGPLEGHQRGPVRVEAVEDLGVDRVRGLQALLVVRVPALRRKLLVPGAVEIRERAGDHVAVLEPRRVGERLEQAPAHDLEALLGAGWPPRGLDAADDVAETVERLPTALPPDFHVIGLRVRRGGGVRRREADHEQAVVDRLRRFGEHLGEGELRLEATRRQVALVMELARVGDPLVDQDQAWPVLGQELAQRVAGTGCTLVIRGDAGVPGGTPQLPGQLTPQRPHERPVRLGHGIARGDFVADEDDAPRRRQLCGAGCPQRVVDARQLARRGAREQVVESEHRMGLAAAEVGLQLHDRIATLTAEPPYRSGQHSLEALGQIRPPEELGRVPVLCRPFAEVRLPEIGRELRLLVTAARHVLVRRCDLAPRLQRSGGGAVDGKARLLPPFAARLFVEADAQQLHLELVYPGGLRGRDGGEQPARRVEHAVCVIAGERFLVRPAVPVTAQLADEAALGRTEDRVERLVPRLPHQLEERGRVPFRDPPLADRWVVDEGPQGSGAHSLRLDRPLYFAFDKGSQPGLQRRKRLADAFVIADSHVTGESTRFAATASTAGLPPWRAGP